MTRTHIEGFRNSYRETKTGVGAGVIAAAMLLAAATYQTASAEDYSQDSTLDTMGQAPVQVQTPTYTQPQTQVSPAPAYSGPKKTIAVAKFDANGAFIGQYGSYDVGGGLAAMMVNEGLPQYIVSQIERTTDLRSTTVGILGMAFKGESDDIRSSLSYKLKRLLRFRGGSVLCTDPYVEVDPDLVPLDEVLGRADFLIIGAPHKVYADIETDLRVVDVWNLRGDGARV